MDKGEWGMKKNYVQKILVHPEAEEGLQPWTESVSRAYAEMIYRKITASGLGLAEQCWVLDHIIQKQKAAQAGKNSDDPI